jgi:hypothetical protein
VISSAKSPFFRVHTEIIPKIRYREYVNKQIKLKCEYHMKVYGYNPLDNPPQKCDNIRVKKTDFLDDLRP